MTVIAEITYRVTELLTMVVVVMLPVSLLNFMIKRCRDNDMEVEVRIVKGGEN